MKKNDDSSQKDTIPCSISQEMKNLIEDYANNLKSSAFMVPGHGLTETEFHESGLFRAAIERLRGQQAASMGKKKEFIQQVLDALQKNGKIESWSFEGASDRHDYCVRMEGGWTSIIEAKGGLDGNNTNIFKRPKNADEFVIWSLSQNPGTDPKKSTWSGIHTRLGAEIVANSQRIDGLIVWDMLCGTKARPCPKIKGQLRGKGTKTKPNFPPPCIYLFPRTIPEVKNNPAPASNRIQDVRLLKCLHDFFGGRNEDLTYVKIEVRNGLTMTERKTTLIRNYIEVAKSPWTKIRRA
jgi:hypothetical protein